MSYVCVALKNGAGGRQSGPAASGTPTVVLGQTTSQVSAILGAPKQIVDLGSKQIYKYPDMKVIFIDGKVSDVE